MVRGTLRIHKWTQVYRAILVVAYAMRLVLDSVSPINHALERIVTMDLR